MLCKKVTQFAESSISCKNCLIKKSFQKIEEESVKDEFQKAGVLNLFDALNNVATLFWLIGIIIRRKIHAISSLK